ncbi:MAG TPA: tetratricopeptide repeat protein [Candidatus Hydrogenedens sp.]|nr:tetratricopeptide repeat protein [Candidatus Hydrogenedens sp.]
MGRKNREKNIRKEVVASVTVNTFESSIFRKIAVYLIIPLCLLTVVLALSPFTGDPAAPIKYLIISIFVFIFSALSLIMVWLEGINLKFKKSLTFMLGGFLLFMFLATIFARNKGFAISEFSIWLMLCFLALFVNVFVVNVKETWWVLGWVMVATALSSVYGFFQQWGIDPFPWATRSVEEYRGLPSSYANPNFAGHALLFAVITGIGGIVTLVYETRKSLIEENRKNFKLTILKLALFVICFLLTFTHLYLTRMRSARIALSIAILFFIFYILLGKKWEIRWILSVGGILLILAAIQIVILFALLAKGYPQGSLPVDNSVNLRLNGYLGAVQMIKDKPLLGYGPGNYRFDNIPYWTNYEKVWFTLAKKRNFHVHCDPLEAMTDAGIPGGLFYFGMILLGFIGGMYLVKQSKSFSEQILGTSIASIFLAFAMDACFGFNMRVPVSSMLFFLYLGLSQVHVDDITLTGKKSKLLSVIVCIVFLILMIQQSRLHCGEMLLQKARGGSYWAQMFANQQKENLREQVLSKAIEHAEKANSIKYFEPRFPEVAARIYMTRNEFQPALEYFDRALKYDSYNPELWTTRAQCCLNWVYRAQLEKKPLPMSVETILDEAEKSLTTAMKYCETYPDIYEGMARTLFFKSQYLKLTNEQKRELMEGIIDYGNKALENGLKESQSLLQILIQAHLYLKDYDGCAEVVERALAMEPSNIELWSRYAQVMKQKNYPDNYLPFLEKNYIKFKRDAETMAPTLSQLALMIYQERLRKTNDIKKASEIILETLKLNPGDLSTWGTVIQTVPREKKLSQLQELVKSLKDTSDIPNLIKKLNYPVEKINWLDISREVISELEQSEKQKVPYKTLVLRYVWIAEVAFDTNIKMESEYKAELFVNLATIYQKLRFYDRALACYPEASKVTDRNTQLRVLYSWAETLYNRRQYSEAEKKLQQALEIEPGNIRLRSLLIQTLVQLKKIPEAKLEYQSLKQSLPSNSSTIKELETLLSPYTKTN